LRQKIPRERSEGDPGSGKVTRCRVLSPIFVRVESAFLAFVRVPTTTRPLSSVGLLGELSDVSESPEKSGANKRRTVIPRPEVTKPPLEDELRRLGGAPLASTRKTSVVTTGVSIPNRRVASRSKGRAAFVDGSRKTPSSFLRGQAAAQTAWSSRTSSMASGYFRCACCTKPMPIRERLSGHQLTTQRAGRSD
jgi:hypothetical protein